MFAVGEEVVCVNDKMSGDHVREGSTYVIVEYKPPTQAEKAGGMTGFVIIKGKEGLFFTADRFCSSKLYQPKQDYSKVDFFKINRGVCGQG
jgi:hypothetical protein